MAKEEFMNMQHSESVVAQMAATIFSSLVAATPLTDANEDALIEKSVALAIKIANKAENAIKSDGEWMKSPA